METIWMDGIPGTYHDLSCRCEGHCRNCYDDLAAIRALRERLRAEGPLGARSRYCSGYCRNRAKRERALDRALAAVTVSE